MAKGANLYAVYLKLLQDSFVFPGIDRVLQPIGKAIVISVQHVEASDYESVTEHHLNAIIEEETDVVENLLGTAFVVCQTYISTVISRVCALHRLYKKEHKGEGLTTTTTKKSDIMAFGSSRVGCSIFSQVQVIDAFANYFKHREEWIGEWNKLPGQNAGTAQIILAAGASWGATGNLHTGAKVLGNESYTNLSVFTDILQRWRQNLHNGYREELMSRHLI